MRLKRVLAVLTMHLKTFYREKSALFFTIAFPIILMLLFGFIFQDFDKAHYVIYVQDMDDTDLSHNLTDTMDSVKSLEVKTVPKGADPKKFLKDHDSDFMVIIPQGYQSTIMRRMAFNDTNATVNLTLVYDPSAASAAIKVSLVQSTLSYINKGMAGTNDTILTSPESMMSQKFSYIEFFIPAVIGMTVMTSAVFGTIYDENDYKSKGIIRKLSTTPITRGEWILSTMLYQLMMAALASSLILMIGYFVFGAVLYMNLFVPVILLLEAFAFSGLGMLVGRVVKEAQSAAAVGNLITFPMMFLSGTFYPVEQMPAFLQTTAKALPLYYVNQGLRDAMIMQDFASATMNTLVVAVTAIILFFGGVYLTTWKQQ